MEFRFLIAFLLLSIGLSAQVYQTNSAPYEYTRGLKADTILVIPRGVDTPAIGNNKFGKPSIGAIFYRSTDSTLWLRSATRWNKTSIVDSFYYTISQLTDTSAAIYRSDGIVDTLAITTGDVSISFDSTSLSNRINLKLNISDTTAMLLPYLRKDDTTAMLSPYIRYAYRTPGVDSIYFVKGSGAIIAVKDSAGGGGGSGNITGTLNDSRLVFSTNGEVKDTSTLVYSRSTGNVGIGGTPDASAQLDVSSTTKGFLPPRMTTAERNAIASPLNGLTVFQTTNNVSQYHDGNAWRNAGPDSGKDVNAARLAGANTIAESYGCNTIYCSTTLSNQPANLAFFMMIYVPHRVTATGISHFFSSNVMVSGALYRLDSDSLRLVDTSSAYNVTQNDFSVHNFVSQHTLNPGLYYAVFKGLSAVSFTRANTGTNTSANIVKIRSSNSNMLAYGFISPMLSYSSSYHLNQITKTATLMYAALY